MIILNKIIHIIPRNCYLKKAGIIKWIISFHQSIPYIFHIKIKGLQRKHHGVFSYTVHISIHTKTAFSF